MDNTSQLTIKINRQTLLTSLVVIQLIALVIMGWQIYDIKSQLTPDGGKTVSAVTKKTKAAPPAPSAAPSPAKPSAATAGDVRPPDENDHYKGSKEAKITLIEYSDFECPFCKRFHPSATAAVENSNGQVNWVYRHYPLSFHANAQKEGEAAECAGEQGGDKAFWEYTDQIFERTSSNGTGFALTSLVPLAGELGLDESKFKDCLDSGKYAQHVKDDMAEGQKAGVTGTPGTFIYNNETGESELVPGAVPYEQLKTAIDRMLAS